MRTDQQILDDRALSDTLVADEKGAHPSNYNLFLLLEVLLDIREYMKENNEKLDELKVELVEIKNNTAS